MSKPLTGFRVAVLATDGVEEAELTKPVKALKDAGAKVTLVSLKPGEIQAVRHDGGTWVDRAVVEDGNWVTSRQPADLPAFNRAMLFLFTGSLVPSRK